nr:MAG: hypothetical protein [Rhabdoviridae sp.]WAK77234.1 MAG: hypothetical protein [Rhabdoviridae sp.]
MSWYSQYSCAQIAGDLVVSVVGCNLNEASLNYAMMLVCDHVAVAVEGPKFSLIKVILLHMAKYLEVAGDPAVQRILAGGTEDKCRIHWVFLDLGRQELMPAQGPFVVKSSNILRAVRHGVQFVKCDLDLTMDIIDLQTADALMDRGFHSRDAATWDAPDWVVTYLTTLQHQGPRPVGLLAPTEPGDGEQGAQDSDASQAAGSSGQEDTEKQAESTP